MKTDRAKGATAGGKKESPRGHYTEPRESAPTLSDLRLTKRESAFELKYGSIRPKTDRRCFRREMIEELLDSLNYCEWAKVKGEINRKQFQEIDRTTRKVICTIEAACNDRFEWETNWI